MDFKKNTLQYFNQFFVWISMHGRNKWKTLVALSKTKLKSHCELWGAVLLEVKPVTLAPQQRLMSLSIYIFIFRDSSSTAPKKESFHLLHLKIQDTAMRNSQLQFYYWLIFK